MSKKHGKIERYHQTFEAPNAKILVVDDTPANILVVKKLLRDTKVTIDTAGSGMEALKKTLEQSYHVIFMDHMMPEMDGIECMHAIKTQIGGQSKESKIVALTANAGSDISESYAKEGFDGYLIKPVSGIAIESELYRQLPKNLVTKTGSGEDILEESTSWITVGQEKKATLIATDSVADLPQEIIRQYDIAVLPHKVVTKCGVFRDGIEVETDGLLSYMMEAGMSVENVSPEIVEYELFFAELLSRANHIVFISVSSQVAASGCIKAKEAAKTFDNVQVFDSDQLSSGQGLLVIEAARMAEAGKSPEEILAQMERLKTKVSTNFIVDKLDYLAAASQINKSIVNITKSLMIRPVIHIKKGQIKVKRIFFGAQEVAWEKFIRSTLNRFGDIDKSILFITHAGLTRSELNKIKEYVNKRESFENVFFQKVSPTVAVNCGPGTFGLIFMKK